MLKALEIAFTEMDAEFLAKQTKWALDRKAAVAAMRAELQPRRREMGEWEFYGKLFYIAGGKTWYNVFQNNTVDTLPAFIAKNCKTIANKRNATIIAKLAKIGVTEINNLEFGRTNDGYNGIFVFDNARVEIRTIIAGGYNIQCMHQRTLVYVNGKAAR